VTASSLKADQHEITNSNLTPIPGWRTPPEWGSTVSVIESYFLKGIHHA
jgi:hypothetical protein